MLRFKIGDKVQLTAEACSYYGGKPPFYYPVRQGGGTPGEVLFAGDRPFKPGATPRPYYVRWENGTENSYREQDLEAVFPIELDELLVEAAMDPDPVVRLSADVVNLCCRLSEDAREIAHNPEVMASLERGIADAAAGRTMSLAEAKQVLDLIP